MSTAPTVQAELENRHDCRYGLRGVRVRYRGAEYLVLHSHWDREGNLRLALMVPGQVDVTWLTDTPQTRERLKAGFLSLGDYLIAGPGELTDVPAAACVLVSQWPLACCRPSRRNPWNSRKQARLMGIAPPEEIASRYEFASHETFEHRQPAN